MIIGCYNGKVFCTFVSDDNALLEIDGVVPDMRAALTELVPAAQLKVPV